MSSIWPPQWLYPSNVSSAPNDPFGTVKHLVTSYIRNIRGLVILPTTTTKSPEATGFSLCRTLCLGSLRFDAGKFASLLGPRHRTVSLRLLYIYIYDHIYTVY